MKFTLALLVAVVQSTKLAHSAPKSLAQYSDLVGEACQNNTNCDESTRCTVISTESKTGEHPYMTMCMPTGHCGTTVSFGHMKATHTCME